MLTFAGKPRNQRLYAQAQETPVMYIPLALLGVLSIIGGTALGARPMLESAIKETNNYFDPRLRPPIAAVTGSLQPPHFEGFSTVWQNAGAYAQGSDPIPPGIESDAFHHGEHALRYASFAFLLSIPLG